MSSALPTGNIQQRLASVRAQFDTLRGGWRTKLDSVRSQVWSRGLGGGVPSSPIKTYTSNAGGGQLLKQLQQRRGGRGSTGFVPNFRIGPNVGVGPNTGMGFQGRSRSNMPGGNSGLQGADQRHIQMWRGQIPNTYPAQGAKATPVQSYSTPIKTFEGNVKTFEQVSQGVRTPIRTY